MLKSALRALALACLVSGASACRWVNSEEAEAFATQRQALREAERIVRAHAYDPDSVVIESAFFNAAGTGVCGVMNARNRMGGYAGARRFATAPSGTLWLEPEAPPLYAGGETNRVFRIDRGYFDTLYGDCFTASQRVAFRSGAAVIIPPPPPPLDPLRQ